MSFIGAKIVMFTSPEANDRNETIYKAFHMDVNEV